MEGIDENVASNRDIGEIERRILDQVPYSYIIVCAVPVDGKTPTIWILCVR